MKAAVLHKARDLRIEEIEKPELESSEALVKVNAVGICGSDIHYYKYGRVGTRLVRKPHILGHEVSGIIEAVGKNDRGLKKGMAVGIDPSIPCGECE
ncbi:MAG: alcohol dehydrogenase catalytic domain-containing protein, partial [Candidatus Helarchaeota archaeon]|nr:alcohol dehydrogenase catalytic domain-containing protein [Candidatus Helarchaeota archaeon]